MYLELLNRITKLMLGNSAIESIIAVDCEVRQKYPLKTDSAQRG
jgi:hypothetical protein